MKRRKIYFAPSSSLLLLLPRHPSLPETHTHTLERTTNPPFECVCFTTEQREYALLLQKLSSKIFSYKINSAAKKKTRFSCRIDVSFRSRSKNQNVVCFSLFLFYLCVGKGGAFFRQERLWRACVFRVCVCVCFSAVDLLRLYKIVRFLFLSTLSSIYLFSSSWKTRFLFSPFFKFFR